MPKYCPTKAWLVDWNVIPPIYKWAACDGPDGTWYVYERRPNHCNDQGTHSWRDTGEWMPLSAYQAYEKRECTRIQAIFSLRERPST